MRSTIYHPDLKHPWEWLPYQTTFQRTGSSLTCSLVPSPMPDLERGSIHTCRRLASRERTSVGWKLGNKTNILNPSSILKCIKLNKNSMFRCLQITVWFSCACAPCIPKSFTLMNYHQAKLADRLMGKLIMIFFKYKGIILVSANNFNIKRTGKIILSWPEIIFSMLNKQKKNSNLFFNHLHRLKMMKFNCEMHKSITIQIYQLT